MACVGAAQWRQRRLGGIHNSAVHAAACIRTTCRIPASMCGCARADAGRIEAGCSCRVGLRPGLCRSPAPARRRALRAWQDGLAAWASHWAQEAKLPWWTVARWQWWERVRDAGTMRGRWHGSVVAERGLPTLLGGGSLVTWFYWFLAPIWFFGPGRQAHTIGAGARRGAGLRDLAYGVSTLFSQPCVRLVALRVLWTARAARRPFPFWIGRRARSGCAGPSGPRPLAPPHRG